MSVINTNYLALVSQNNLTKSQNSLGTAIERLSSGLRINSAKDDAAGQAIANRFTANVNGLTQAARNANDGISIAQTTEGSLNEINENLQRIRTLTVQASTGSNSNSDLQSIQNEIKERMDEIDRISEQTQFNGVKVLGDDAAALTVQVGAHDNQTITINLSKIDSASLKLDGFTVAGKSLVKAQGNAANDTISVNGDVYTFKAAADVDKAVGSKDLDATTAPTITATGTAADGGTNTLVKNDKGEVFVKSVDSGTTTYFKAEMEVTPADGTNAAKLTVKVGAEVSNLTETAAEARTTDPLKALDSALQQVDDLRSHLGAIQNRFQSTIANLNNTVNNLSAARSRIEDADYAVEVSNMTRSQILQQAGTSVLAQANQVPQTVLSLLR